MELFIPTIFGYKPNIIRLRVGTEFEATPPASANESIATKSSV
jgi:hypothetical protein